jgi:hypothetical protein
MTPEEIASSLEAAARWYEVLGLPLSCDCGGCVDARKRAKALRIAANYVRETMEGPIGD